MKREDKAESLLLASSAFEPFFQPLELLITRQRQTFTPRGTEKASRKVFAFPVVAPNEKVIHLAWGIILLMAQRHSSKQATSTTTLNEIRKDLMTRRRENPDEVWLLRWKLREV